MGVARKNVAVLNFGSSNIVVLIGDRSVNGTFDVRGYAEVPFAGFMEGEVLEQEKLPEVLSQAINTAQNNAQCKITHLYIGVPSEFCIAEVKNVSLAFGKRKRITDRDVDELFRLADEYSSSPTHSVVNRSPVCFELDTGERVIDPKGQWSESLGATLSFVLAERNFMGLLSSAISSLEIPFVDFISETMAETMYLIEPAERDKCAVFVDCGYLSTSVAVVVGDGIVCLKSFSLGGGHIVADLVKFLEVPFGVATELKKYATLTGQPSENEKITINYKGQKYQFDALAVFEIVQRKVRQIAKMITKSLETCAYERPENICINLTGGGISYIKGVTETLKEYLGKEVKILEPQVPQMNEPKNSAVLGLLDFALKQTSAHYSIFIKIFKK